MLTLLDLRDLTHLYPEFGAVLYKNFGCLEAVRYTGYYRNIAEYYDIPTSTYNLALIGLDGRFWVRQATDIEFQEIPLGGRKAVACVKCGSPKLSPLYHVFYILFDDMMVDIVNIENGQCTLAQTYLKGWGIRTDSSMGVNVKSYALILAECCVYYGGTQTFYDVNAWSLMPDALFDRFGVRMRVDGVVEVVDRSQRLDI